MDQNWIFCSKIEKYHVQISLFLLIELKDDYLMHLWLKYELLNRYLTREIWFQSFVYFLYWNLFLEINYRIMLIVHRIYYDWLSYSLEIAIGPRKDHRINEIRVKIHSENLKLWKQMNSFNVNKLLFTERKFSKF